MDQEFINASSLLDDLLSDKARAERVAEIQEGNRAADRLYVDQLSKIREACAKTQREIAEAMNVSQGSVSRLESQHDMLMSTLNSYLKAAGVEEAHIVTVVNGRHIELDLDELTSCA